MEVDDDPWFWDIERVVKELCAENKAWIPRVDSRQFEDPAKLAEKLREHKICGITLLDHGDNPQLRGDLGLFIFKDWSYFMYATRHLRLCSVEFQQLHNAEQQRKQIFDQRLIMSGETDIVRSTEPGTLVAGPPQKQSTADEILGNSAASEGFSADENHLLSNPTGMKRRRTDDLENSAVMETQHQDEVCVDVDTQSDSMQGTAFETSSNPETLESSNQGPLQKKQKRVAPTLLTAFIDPTRDRSIPTAADSVNLNATCDPQTVQIPQGAFQADNPELHVVSPSPPQCLETSISSANIKEVKKARRKAAALAKGYLGTSKCTINEIFYGETKIGERMESVDPKLDHQFAGIHIANGRRLVVGSYIRKFLLHSTPEAISRNGKTYYAVQPYSSRSLQKSRTTFFTLYDPLPGGQVIATKEKSIKWPELSQNITTIAVNSSPPPQASRSLQEALANKVGFYDGWDVTFLERYEQMDGGDEILPLYGDSGSDGEYDILDWKEMEQENRGLQTTLAFSKTEKQPLAVDEVNATINGVLKQLVNQWKQRKFPKLNMHAWKIWKRSRDHHNKRQQIALKTLHFNKLTRVRIPSIRQGILKERWTSAEQVRKMCGIFEPTVFDIQELEWEISVLDLKRCPPRPPRTELDKAKKAKADKIAARIVAREELDGEEDDSVGSETSSTSDDDMEDFVVADDVSLVGELSDLDAADPSVIEEDMSRDEPEDTESDIPILVTSQRRSKLEASLI
jgi:hypothetical protein